MNWQLYEHITAPRRAWYEGEAGRLRQIERQLKELPVTFTRTIGGSRVYREDVQTYLIFTDADDPLTFRSTRGVLAYILHGVKPRAYKPPAVQTSDDKAAGKSARHTSQYHGVTRSRRNRRWSTRIYIQSREIWIGHFDNEEDAARAYDAYVLEHGLNKALNFPQERAA